MIDLIFGIIIGLIVGYLFIVYMYPGPIKRWVTTKLKAWFVKTPPA